MRHERVKITRDGNTVHNRTVPTWEIPVLEFLFDPGNVEPLGEFVEGVTVKDANGDNAEYPEAGPELARLTKAYGADPKSGIAHANAVYGNGRRGVTELRKLIDTAKSEDAEARKAKKPAPAKRVKRAAYEPASDESLLS